jgi:hypothetical protein
VADKPRTIGDFVCEVMAIDNEVTAQKFFEAEVALINAQILAGTWKSRCSAEEGARANIGFCFGEGMASERVQMWIKVCDACHPWFGQAVPSGETAFRLGFAAGSARR